MLNWFTPPALSSEGRTRRLISRGRSFRKYNWVAHLSGALFFLTSIHPSPPSAEKWEWLLGTRRACGGVGGGSNTGKSVIHEDLSFLLWFSSVPASLLGVNTADSYWKGCICTSSSACLTQKHSGEENSLHALLASHFQPGIYFCWLLKRILRRHLDRLDWIMFKDPLWYFYCVLVAFFQW